MGPVTEPLSDAEFDVHANAMLHGDRPDEALNEPGYKHRQGEAALHCCTAPPCSLYCKEGENP
jgi:hypothetical protein